MIESLLGKFTKRVEKKYPHLQVVLMGSVARGERKPGKSDLDILVFASQRIPKQTKRDLYEIFLKLSIKHELNLKKCLVRATGVYR